MEFLLDVEWAASIIASNGAECGGDYPPPSFQFAVPVLLGILLQVIERSLNG